MRVPAVGAILLVLLLNAAAQSPKTADYVTIAGGRTVVIFGRADVFTIDGVPTYVRVGLVSCLPRPKAALPLTVTLSSRGYPGIAFIDFAPLLDALPWPSSDAAVREALGASGPGPQGSETLDAVTKRRSEIVQSQLKLYGLSGLADLPRLMERQSTVVTALQQDGAILPSQLFPNELLKTGAIRPILTFTALSHDRPHFVAYMLRERVDSFAPGSAEIQVGASDAPADTALTIQLAEAKSWWETEGGKAILAPFLSALGTLVGAAIGFQYFLRQQSIQHDEYLRQKFHERKYENREKLKTYFDKTYPALRRFGRTDARSVRQSLWDEQIDVLLAPSAVAELDRIAADRAADREAGLARIDQFLRTTFPEFHGGFSN